MTTQVEVCNAALAMVGADLIVSIDDLTVEAKLCRALYNVNRDSALRAHPWNFATVEHDLDLMSGAPVLPEYVKRYGPLPLDVLRVLYINHLGREFRVMGREIHTNEGEALARCIYRADEGLWDANFIHYFAARLSIDLAMPLVQSAELKQNQIEYAKGLLSEARSFNAQERFGDRVISDDWFNARLT